jgi:hypothetical protein
MTDTSFRDRISLWHNAFIGAGIVQTADTGQINFSTVLMPSATNTDAGYAIYRFNDSRQGTDPLFLKIIYGKGNNHYGPRMRVQIGQGSNGSGTLTGNLSNIGIVGGSTGTPAVTSSIQTYACHADGFLSVCVGPGNTANGYPCSQMQITRTRDPATYAFDSLGVIMHVDNGSPIGCGLMHFTRTLNNYFAGSASAHYCIAPGTPASTALSNGDKQLYPHFYADPQVRQLWSQFTVRSSEIGAGQTTFTASPVLAQARTFICYGQGYSMRSESTNPQSTWELCHLWE